MSGNRLASRDIDLGTQILGRKPIHSMGSIVIEIEFQTSILSDYWLAIQVGVVGDSHQFLLLVGIVPQTAFDDLSADTWHVIFNGLVTDIAIPDINDEVITRHLFHAVLIEPPCLLQPVERLIKFTP